MDFFCWLYITNFVIYLMRSSHTWNHQRSLFRCIVACNSRLNQGAIGANYIVYTRHNVTVTSIDFTANDYTVLQIWGLKKMQERRTLSLPNSTLLITNLRSVFLHHPTIFRNIEHNFCQYLLLWAVSTLFHQVRLTPNFYVRVKYEQHTFPWY